MHCVCMYKGLCICIRIYNRQGFPIIDKDFSTDGLFFISIFAKGPGGVCIVKTVCLICLHLCFLFQFLVCILLKDLLVSRF